MIGIDPKLAECFLSACEEGTIRGAAERLGIEPSTVSRQISALEHSLSMTLAERGRRGVQPTEAGRLLVDFLVRQRSDVDSLQFAFDELRGMQRGQISIAVGDGFIGDLVGNAMSSFMSAFPGLTFSLNSGSTERVLHAVRTDQSHLGLAYNARPDRAIKVLAAAKHPLMMLVSPRTDMGRSAAPVGIEDLCAMPCAILTKEFGVGDLTREVEARYGVRFRAVVETSSFAVLRNFVREGMGVTVLPKFVVTREIHDGLIAARPIDVPEFHRGETAIFVRAGRLLPQAVTRFANHAIRAMAAYSLQE